MPAGAPVGAPNPLGAWPGGTAAGEPPVLGEEESMISRLVGVAAVLGAALWAAAAAAETGDPAAGHDLADKLCSSCHIVGNERAGSDIAPPFRTLAKDPDMKLTQLHGWRGPMHPVLSNLALSTQQIADINAYLDSLRPGAGAAAAPGPAKPPAAIRNAPPAKIGEPIGPKPK
jgi:mono/diheme cytochrome c family protein